MANEMILEMAEDNDTNDTKLDPEAEASTGVGSDF